MALAAQLDGAIRHGDALELGGDAHERRREAAREQFPQARAVIDPEGRVHSAPAAAVEETVGVETGGLGEHRFVAVDLTDSHPHEPAGGHDHRSGRGRVLEHLLRLPHHEFALLEAQHLRDEAVGDSVTGGRGPEPAGPFG